MLWKDLRPDPRMLRALDVADEEIRRKDALTGERAHRHKWSNAFADACARMVAGAVERHSAFQKLNVIPSDNTQSELPMFVMGGKQKRIDVVVASMVSGLQVGISLKGMNFRDGSGNQFDKNLTGRTYELQDEVRLVHEYQPAAFLVALYFLPLAATMDKRSETSPSSFARTVEFLRPRTTRLDPTLPSQLSKADMAAVALYVPGDVEPSVPYEDVPARGVVRYFDVAGNPPRRGRPQVQTTLDLEQLVDRIAERYSGGGAEPISWAQPESE